MFKFINENKKIIFIIIILFFLCKKHKNFILKTLDPLFFFSYISRSFLKTIIFYASDKNDLYFKYNLLEEKYEKLRHSYQSLEYFKNSIYSFKKKFSTFNSYNKPFIISKILFLKSSVDEQIFFINSGSKDGVKKGNAIVYGSDLLGIVSKVYLNHSEILMITDSKSKIAVNIGKNLINGITQGFNKKDYIQVFYVEDNLEIKKNDIVYSSGEGLVYPEGFVIGKIKEIIKSDGLYLTLIIEPFFDINKINYCFVLLDENENNENENNRDITFLDKLLFNWNSNEFSNFDKILPQNKELIENNVNNLDKNFDKTKIENQKIKNYLNHFYKSSKNVKKYSQNDS